MTGDDTDAPVDEFVRHRPLLFTVAYEILGSAADAEDVELADAVSFAMLVVLETLGPLERAVYVLREVFGFEYAEVADATGRSRAAVRQIAHRAREHVRARRARSVVDGKTHSEVAANGSRWRPGRVTCSSSWTCWPPTWCSSPTAEEGPRPRCDLCAERTRSSGSAGRDPARRTAAGRGGVGERRPLGR